MTQKIIPFLWFDTEAEAAARFYVSIFRDSAITHISHYGEAGPGPAGAVMVVSFRLNGQEFLALNGGPQYSFTEAISFTITCADQEEVDFFWEKLTAGGEPGPCGWLKDRFGVSWQVVPRVLNDLLGDEDPVKANRVMAAMLRMGKIEIAPLLAAYHQDA